MTVGVAEAIPTAIDTPIELEAGIEVRVTNGALRTGDYWMIPARVATGDVEWPPYESSGEPASAAPPLGNAPVPSCGRRHAHVHRPDLPVRHRQPRRRLRKLVLPDQLNGRGMPRPRKPQMSQQAQPAK